MIRSKAYWILTVVSMFISILGIGMGVPPQVVHAAGVTYYVSPTGSASNNGLSTSTPWSLTKAASTAAAGDTVLFMDGIYSDQLVPQNSGTATNPILFKALNKGQATLTYPNADSYIVQIKGKSFITLNGFKLTSHLNLGKWLKIDSTDGTMYSAGTANGTPNSNITISDCVFSYATAGWGYRAPIFINYTSQLKLLNNIVTEAYLGDDLITFSNSSKLLIEGNNFSKARHTVLNFSYFDTNYNTVSDVVVRNNVFNSQWSRNFEIFPNNRILLEGNVFAEQRYGSGNASSRNSVHADGTIFRYNRFIRNYSGGTLGSAPYSANMSFQNSVFYNNIYAENEMFVYLFGGNGVFTIKNNFFKNNIFYNNDNNASNTNLRYFERAFNDDGSRTLSFIKNNFWHGPGVTPYFLGNNNSFLFNSDYKLWSLSEVESMSAAVGTKVPLFAQNMNINPLFTDPSNYNYTLQPGSPMIDSGTDLTTAIGAGSGSTSLTVNNPNYFFDGWGIDNQVGDIISVGTSANRARITNIAYTKNAATGVITSGVLSLDTALSWGDGASVNLAYDGSAPDMGIVETGADAPDSLQVTSSQFKAVTGSAVPFSATVFGSFIPASYSWSFGDGSTGTGASPSHAYTQPGQYAVYSKATDASGKSISGIMYVIINATDYLSQPMLYNSFDADDNLYTQIYRHSSRGNEVTNYERIYENGTNGVIHVYYKSGNDETEQLRFGNYPPDWNINQFPIVSAKYKVNPGTPLVLALEAYPIRLDNRTYPIAATASSNEPTAAYTLIDDGQWHTIEVDVRAIRNLGGTYAGLNYLRSASFRTMAAGSTGQEYWMDDFTIKPAPIPPTTTDNAPTGWVNQDTTVNLSVTEGTSVVAATYYTVDGGTQQTGTSIVLTTEGVHTLTYWSVDISGNMETPHTATVRIDKTVPADATLAADITAPTNTDVTVTISYPADAAVKEYKVGTSGAWTAYVIPVVVSANETVYARGTDAAGNVSNVSIYVVYNIDDTIPTATVTYSSITAQSVTATITPSEPVTITNNGGSSSYTFLYNDSFTFEIVDAAGNHGTAMATVANIAAKSKTKPSTPILSDSNGNDTGLQDGNYRIAMNMWYGENGRIYKLYENGKLIDTQILTDHSPSAQSTVTSITYKQNGTYRYYAELTNAFGTTMSGTHVVTVTKAAPGKSVLSNDNWDGDGNFKVSMNMWWGTNGGTYNLYENGVLIYSEALADHTPDAQSSVSTLVNRAKGNYEYRAELINYGGATASEIMIVNVTK
ncbi:OmpL47-type beta-barrel domain-containing protein [Paenibacillus oryzisoli]|nr:PKD domain-containing protein [Paenibacillus oryzisoli]